MLNSKKITIGGREVTVCEVRARRILSLLPFSSAGQKADEDQVEQGFAENLDELLREACGLSTDELQELHGSEIKALWAAFREVNDFFFEMVRGLGLEQQIKELLGTLLTAYGQMFASLFAGVTSDASISDLVGLLEPSPKNGAPKSAT